MEGMAAAAAVEEGSNDDVAEPRECCVCESEGPVHDCTGSVAELARASTLGQLPTNTLLVMCEDEEHANALMCVECCLKNLLINRAMPKCVHAECRRMMPFALAQEFFGGRHPDCAALIEFLRASYESIYHPACPKCHTRGDARGDGTISFARARTRKRKTSCWTADGAHVSSDKTFDHPDLCETCCGPWQRCMCEAASKPFHANAYFRDAGAIAANMSGGRGARKPFIQRNHQLTTIDVEEFLQWLLTFANKEVPAVCPACSSLLWRTEDCNELSCCGGMFRICFHCGHAGRGPSLVDHYVGNGGTCVRWPKTFRDATTGEKCPCTTACQSHFRDCAVPQHAKWRAMYADVRLRTWGRRFLRSLSKPLAKHALRWLVARFHPEKPPVRLPIRLEPLKMTGVRIPEFSSDDDARVKAITGEWIRMIDDRLS